MEENREQILADFQSCTGIDDVAECIMHLEATDWNLLNAIHNVIPEESQALPSEREMEIPIEVESQDSSVEELPAYTVNEVEVIQRSSRSVNNLDIRDGDSDDVIMESSSERNLPACGDGIAPPEAFHGPRNLPMIVNDVRGRDEGSSSSFSPRLLNFEVRYKENMVPLEVPDSATVGEIKSALQSELGVPVCRQELCGWRRNHITDDTLLSSLHLPSRTNLFLTAADPSSFPQPATSNLLNFEQSLNKNYKLHIIDTTNNKEYDLSFHGTKTVLEVKLGCRDITNIPVRFQKWIGWPDAAKDENTTLAALDFESPLELILSRDENAKPKKQLVVDLTSSESSENEFEDAAECFGVDDEMFQTGTFSNRVHHPLIPEGLDEEAAARNFEKEFENRYGLSHPPFFQGTLADALQASCQKPARERLPLAIYLHHDASVLTNVFCTQLLCSESIISYLTLNFITWAWDLTDELNKTRLLGMVSHHLGMWASSAIRNLRVDNLPTLMIISKVRSMSEVLTVIPGNVSPDELMTRLLHSREVFNSEISNEIREEDEREARELVKREQDAAYEASLMADRAKEEARRQEEEKKIQEDIAAQKEKEEEELMQKQEEAIKKAIQMSLAEQLPPEPEENSSLPVSHIRVRLPNGVTMARRFLASDTLETLLKYIASQGFPRESYKVLASWPRQDLTSLNGFRTLEELKLFPKETVTLEER